MLFNSVEFLLFLPAVFAIYWLLNGKLKWQNAFVVVASYFFYGWWDWRFLILIAFTTLCSYASGRWIGWVYEATNSMMLVVEWLNRSREHGFTIDAVKPRWLRWLIYYAICMGIILFSQQSETFIYFQF